METCGGAEVELPGFRFHPTEEELLDFYLRRAVTGKKLSFEIIETINLYLYDPWDLPALAKMGEREWYFFVPRDRRQGNGGRPNRTTERGFWKATGSDRPIRSIADPRRLIGFKKTLVYYRGRAPRGSKTEWVMNEYRLPDIINPLEKHSPPPKEDIVICKVYRKATTMKELEQRAAMEEESSRAAASAAETASTSSGYQENLQRLNCDEAGRGIKEENDAGAVLSSETAEVSSAAALIFGPVPLLEPSAAGILQPPHMMRQPPNLPAIQVPTHSSFDWMQDPFVNQLRSPWLDQWSPLYAQLLNF